MVVYTRIHLVIVSIHTPTQGVTIPCPVWRGCIIVSIHTPTQGVTAATIFCSEFNKFQSTHPRRVWLIYHFLHFRTECFNPHTHAGCDDVTVYFSVSAKVSIHTPTQGVTVATHTIYYRSICFNPHTHAGCDLGLIGLDGDGSVSIHTPTQGVTKPLLPFLCPCKVSIHTPTQGVTLYNLIERTIITVSIHTPTQGVTYNRQNKLNRQGFNPHTHAGCDGFFRKNSLFQRFQSTHPRRVWPYKNLVTVDGKVSIHTPTQGVTIP